MCVVRDKFTEPHVLSDFDLKPIQTRVHRPMRPAVVATGSAGAAVLARSFCAAAYWSNSSMSSGFISIRVGSRRNMFLEIGRKFIGVAAGE